MKIEKKESFRSIYIKAWEAADFLSENDRMEVFDGKFIWLFGFIAVTAGVLFLGMALWNLIESKLKVEGVYVLFTVAGLAIVSFIVYMIYISLHNREVYKSKSILADTKNTYPEVYELVMSHIGYHLIPSAIDKLDQLEAMRNVDDEEDYDEPETPQEEYYIEENSTGLDYEELIQDERVAEYLDVTELSLPSTEEILAELRAIRRG